MAIALSGSLNVTGSLLVGGSPVILSNQTSSMSASYAVTSSYAVSASYLIGGGGGGGNIAVSAGASSANLSSLVFSNSNGMSFGLNGSTITANYSAPVESYFEHIPIIVNTTSISLGGSSMYVQPFVLPSDVQVGYVRMPVSIAFGSTTYGTTANSAVFLSNAMTFWANIYSMGTGANSRSLQYITGASATMQMNVTGSVGAASNNQTVFHNITMPVEGGTTNLSTNYNLASANQNISTTHLTAYTGYRFLDMNMNALLPAGAYWMGIQRSSVSNTTGVNTITGATMGQSYIAVSQISQNVNLMGATGGSSQGLQLGLGYWSTNTVGRTTNSIGQSLLSTIANQPRIPFQMINMS
jgi:hypothetical protein